MKLGATIQRVERQPVRVVYLRHTGPLGEPVGRFWRAIVAPRLADLGLLDCPRYGVSQDDAGTAPPDSHRYDACVELPRGLMPPDLPEAVIAGGRYAVMHFAGTAAEIGAAWDAFIRRAVADTALHIDTGRRPFEHYPRGAAYDTRTCTFSGELCLPLAE